MKLKSLFFRDKQEVEVREVETWEVRWRSRYGDFSGCTQPEIKVFLSKPEANEFADALRDAFKLIRHTAGDNVTVERQKTDE